MLKDYTFMGLPVAANTSAHDIAYKISTKAYHLRKAGKIKAAEALARHALAMLPDDPYVQNQTGGILIAAGKYKEAETLLRASIVNLPPETAQIARFNVGLVLQHQGRLSDALDVFLGQDWNLPYVRWEIFNTMALMGDWDKALPYFEARREMNAKDYAISLPDWDGKTSGHLVVVAEQGAGDILQFMRYVPLARKSVSKISLCTPLPFLGLLGDYPGVDAYIPGMDGCPIPAADFWCPLMSLPLLLGTGNRIPNDPDVIRPRVQKYIDSTGFFVKPPPGKLAVGLIWAGSKTHERDWQRSMNLEDLLPLLAVPDVALGSLQIGRDGEIEHCGVSEFVSDHAPILSAGVHYATGMSSWVKSAAVLMGLDLLITVDTGMAHLAGILGVPCWIMLPHMPDWRWKFKGTKTPWYPKTRLFRQHKPNDWSGVVEQVVRELFLLSAR